MDDIANAFRFSNSAHEVAMSANRHGWLGSKDVLADWSAMERRSPRGSSSNNVPLNEVDSNAFESASMESPDRSKIPPSMAFNCSCVIVAVAVGSRIEGAEAEEDFEYAFQRCCQSSAIVRWYVGLYPSKAMWKLVPPNPNAETPARRGCDSGSGHSSGDVGTKKGMFSQSTVGFGVSNPAEGGMVR